MGSHPTEQMVLAAHAGSSTRAVSGAAPLLCYPTGNTLAVQVFPIEKQSKGARTEIARRDRPASGRLISGNAARVPTAQGSQGDSSGMVTSLRNANAASHIVTAFAH
jgi:hypothetical protein